MRSYPACCKTPESHEGNNHKQFRVGVFKLHRGDENEAAFVELSLFWRVGGLVGGHGIRYCVSAAYGSIPLYILYKILIFCTREANHATGRDSAMRYGWAVAGAGGRCGALSLSFLSLSLSLSVSQSASLCLSLFSLLLCLPASARSLCLSDCLSVCVGKEIYIYTHMYT